MTQATADAKAQALRAEGQAQAIGTVFKAIHDGKPDAELLAYQYLQMLPQIAKGDANKLWIVPSEMGKALEGLGSIVGGLTGASSSPNGSPAPVKPAVAKPAAIAPPEAPAAGNVS